MADQRTVAATGNVVVAEAFRQCAPDVVAAYPITPQTTIVEEFAKFVAQGKVHTEYVTVESEHSALSSCIGASAAGARVMTATSSQGLAYMWEMLGITSGMRLPIVMANANRALSAPINIHCDHSDIMSARDQGWIMLFAETAQEAYDNTFIALKAAEDADVLLPAFTCLDGFITTHSIDRVSLLDDATIKAYVGDYEPVEPLLDTDNPVGYGNFAGLGGPFFEFKHAQRLAIDRADAVVRRHAAEYSALSGRPWGAVESWGMEDADVAVVAIGSTAGNARHVAKQLRSEGGIKAGVVKIRMFRPFPAADIVAALRGTKAIAVLDRSESFGAEGGPLFAEIRSALYDSAERVPVVDYIYGLGGSDVKLQLMRQVIHDLGDIASGSAQPRTLTYLGTRKEA
jgi:pyruvate ferredoxin oxidoreductase alpha subunit